MARDPDSTKAKGQRGGGKGEADRQPKRLQTWQKTLLVASIALSVIGLVMMGVAWATGPDEAAVATGQTDKSIASGFAPTGEGETASDADEPDPGAMETWSPAVFRLGFSFFVGFAIAYALRTFVKISIVAIGLVLLTLFGLQYAGVLDVNWAAMEGHFDTAMAWIKEEAASFRDFITGYVPSAASALGGMFVGFKKG